MNLRIGSRGSQLALWQANHVAELLRGQGHSVEIAIIKTTGDRLQNVAFAQAGSKGMFIKEIEEALAGGRIDLAVHSLKDMPTELPEPFILAATPARADARDAFVSVRFKNLAALPVGARVGTSSLRRSAQLKAILPDIEVIEFRGNVETRLRKLTEGRVDATLLSAAGLDRLDKTEWLRERLDPRFFCPAAGQGALGIETRKDDAAVIAAVQLLDDAATRFAVTAERVALAALGGGCQVPIGVFCWTEVAPAAGRAAEQWNEIIGVVADPVTGRAVRVHHQESLRGSLNVGAEAAELGELAAQMLIEAGAGPLLAAVPVAGSR
jgi:hydroxymethylbilane synthase